MFAVEVEPLGKPGIEYADVAKNPYSGCKNIAYGLCALGTDCWAYRRAKMLAKNPAVTGYNREHPFMPTFHPKVLADIRRMRKPTRIACSFMGDIGYCQENWLSEILDCVRDCPQHRFYFLTKCPNLLPPQMEWPNNAWLGVSVNDQADMWRVDSLYAQRVAVKWVSIEPMLECITLTNRWEKVNWVVIGAQTGAHPKQPETRWVELMLGEAHDHELPVFVKPNVTGGYPREFPAGVPV